MAVPTPVRPEEVPKDLVPPEKIIESLPSPEQISPSSPEKVATSPTPLPDETLVVPPLRWEEVVPSWADIKAVLRMIALVVASVAITLGFWILALKVSSARLHQRPPGLGLRAEPVPLAPSIVPHRLRAHGRTFFPRMNRSQVSGQATPISQATPAALTVAVPVAPTVAPAEVATPLPVAVVHPAPPPPENLRAQFYSPLNLELTWDSLGENYRYRLYSAASATMADAQPETDGPILAPYVTWLPRREADTMWVAVTSLDPQGHESAFGRPLFIRLR
jgi:hypothetical protein